MPLTVVPPSYAPLMRSEIESDVLELKVRFAARFKGAPTSVKLGYALNSHRGRPIFAAGDRLQGLKVKIDPYSPHVIMISGPNGEEAMWR